MKKRRPPTIPGWLRHGAFECIVDGRGRITLPSAVREYMHLEAGEKIQFTIGPIEDEELGAAMPNEYYAVLKRLGRRTARGVDREF